MARQNHALASNGASITATSNYSSGFPESSIIDGTRHTNNAWGSNGAWASRNGTPFDNDAQGGRQRLILDLGQVRHVDEMRLYGVSSSANYNTEPNTTETTVYPNTDFTIKYWNGSAWTNAITPVTANDKTRKDFTSLDFYTQFLCLEITKATGGFATIAEWEVWGNITSSASLTLTPSTLTDATNGSAYSQALTGGGGTSTYKTGTGDNLPNGITLASNTIAGTPDLPLSNILLITEGDSKTSEQYQRTIDTGGSWGYQTAQGLSCDFYNVATSSETLADTLSQYTTQVQPLIDNRYAYIFACNAAGTNDIYFESNPDSTFVAGMQSDITDWCDLCVTDGILPIVATIMPRGDAPWTSTKETARQSYNTWLRANWASIGAVKLLDWEVDDTNLADYNDTTYYQTDKLHDKSAGQTAKANIAISKISAYLSANPMTFTAPETFSFDIRVFDSNLTHADISYTLDVDAGASPSTTFKVFPIDLSGLQATIYYSTQVIVGKGGNEVRVKNWQYPIREYDLSFLVKTQADVDTLVEFFHTTYGNFSTFYLFDTTEFSYDLTETENDGDGTETDFQMVKRYTDILGNVAFRPVKRIKEGTVEVRVDNVLKVEGINYTVDYSTGIITFMTAPANGAVITQKCEFYVKCRFMDESLPIQQIIHYLSTPDRDLYQVPSIPVKEVRE